jgi:hypothetical protein
MALVRWSSLGSRSRFLRIVWVAVATMPFFHVSHRETFEVGMCTRLNSPMAHVDKEDIDSRLGSVDHVFSRCHIFNDSVCQLSMHPAIPRLVLGLIPVKQLWDLVRHSTHTAAPTREGDRLKVRSTIELMHRLPPSMNCT